MINAFCWLSQMPACRQRGRRSRCRQTERQVSLSVCLHLYLSASLTGRKRKGGRIESVHSVSLLLSNWQRFFELKPHFLLFPESKTTSLLPPHVLSDVFVFTEEDKRFGSDSANDLSLHPPPASARKLLCAVEENSTLFVLCALKQSLWDPDHAWF